MRRVLAEDLTDRIELPSQGKEMELRYRLGPKANASRDFVGGGQIRIRS